MAPCTAVTASTRFAGEIAMTKPPYFATTSTYLARLNDAEFWWPHVVRVLERHGLCADGAEVLSGSGGTFPTFIQGNIVVKLYGHLPFWARAHAAERAASICAATATGVLAPSVLAQGWLLDNPESPWPYLVTTRMPGATWEDAGLSAGAKETVAADLGRQVRILHTLKPVAGVATPKTWPTRGIAEAARQTVLPAHLADQADDYVAGTDSSGGVFVHGDLMFRHIFVADDRLAGTIDRGDALVTDRHYELAQLHLNLFDGDKSLLRSFLDHSNWPVGRGFARRALAQAFRRQAIGLAQHRTMDVFYKLPKLLPLEEIHSLEELAEALFGL